jgi:hypothetical protein
LREVEKEARARGFQCIAGRVLDFGGKTGEDALAAITAKLAGSSVELSTESK